MGRRSAYRIKAKSGEGTGDDDDDEEEEEEEEENGSGNDDDDDGDDGDDALSFFLALFSATVFGSEFLTGQSPGTRETRRAKLQGLQWRRGFT